MAKNMFDFDEAIRICGDLIAISASAFTDITELREQHPSWNPDTDIRISGFAKLSNTLRSTSLGLDFYAIHLISPDWWDKKSSGFSPEDKKRINRAFVDFQKFGLIQLGFVSIESTFREILRAIDSSACNGGTDAFKNIYECLIRTKLSGVNVKACDLLDLWREIRNTTHNNGVYFSKDRSDSHVTYKGNSYDFRHGQKIDFVTWDLLADLYEDIRVLLREVVDHSIVSGIAGTITDPYA